MTPLPDDLVIPDKPAFKPAEVCELLKLQPYVLRTWEKEFKDLGVARPEGGPRVYRRVDVERAARIKHLMLVEGLTLAGVRRRFEEESGGPSDEDLWLAQVAAADGGAGPVAAAQAAPRVSDEVRGRLAQVRDGLRELLSALSREPVGIVSQALGSRRGASRGAGRPQTEPVNEPSLFAEEDEAAGQSAGALSAEAGDEASGLRFPRKRRERSQPAE